MKWVIRIYIEFTRMELPIFIIQSSTF